MFSWVSMPHGIRNLVIIRLGKLMFQFNVLFYCADMCSAAFWVCRILGSSLWNWRNQLGMSHGAVLIHTLHRSWKRRKWPSFLYISMDQDHLKLQSRQARFFTCKLSRLALLISLFIQFWYPLLNNRFNHCITLLMFLKAAWAFASLFIPVVGKEKKWFNETRLHFIRC